ncbi:hypothetical protein NJ7G_2313 [Natrinema sp. J7-2]|nr:hypothetical protein NJ7G_2313 [Natrinema sp. J7-2]
MIGVLIRSISTIPKLLKAFTTSLKLDDCDDSNPRSRYY